MISTVRLKEVDGALYSGEARGRAQAHTDWVFSPCLRCTVCLIRNTWSLSTVDQQTAGKGCKEKCYMAVTGCLGLWLHLGGLQCTHIQNTHNTYIRVPFQYSCSAVSCTWESKPTNSTLNFSVCIWVELSFWGYFQPSVVSPQKSNFLSYDGN